MSSQTPNIKTKLSHILNNIDSILYMAEIEASNLLTHLNTNKNKDGSTNSGTEEFHPNNFTRDVYDGIPGVYNNNNNLSKSYVEKNIEEENNVIVENVTHIFPIHSIRFYVEGVVLVPVSIIGLLVNILSVVILTRKRMRTGFNLQLAGLSGYNILYLTTTLHLFGFPQISDSFTSFVYPFILPITFGLAHIARVGSVLATLLVTIERFVAVVYPLKRMTKSTSVSLIYCSIIIAISYNIPRFFEFDRITVEQTQNITSPAMATNPTHNMKLLKTTVAIPTDLRTNQLYIQIYILWMKMILIELIPYGIILVLNTWMAIEMLQASSQRRLMTSTFTIQRKKDFKSATTLLCIAILFIACQSPKIIPDVYEAWNCSYIQETACKSTFTIEVLISISNLLMAINASATFFIYFFNGDKFRAILRKWIKKSMFWDHQQPDHTSEMIAME